jgi:lipopolysaccharide export system permease protein
MAMKLFERYLGRELATASGIVLLGFVALFSFFEFIGELESVGRGGDYSLWQAFLVSLLRTPARAYETIPIAVLVGCLYGLGQLAKSSELNVLRVSGVSTRGLLFVMFKVAALFAVLTILTGEVIAPISERLAQELRPKGYRSAVSFEFRSGYWLRDGRAFVNIRSVQQNARLMGVNLYEFDEHKRLVRIASAVEGDYLPPNAWRFRDIIQTDYLPDGGAATRHIEEMVWRSDLNPDMLGVLNILPERMSIVNLGRYIRHLGANSQSVERYEIAFWNKLTYPLGVFVMVALALPFGYMHSRVAGMGLKIFVGVMIGVVFYMLNGLSSSLGMLNHWPPFLTAVGPESLFLLFAVFLLWRVDRR